jgi:hypothetical protein
MRPEALDKLIKFSYILCLVAVTFQRAADCVNHYAVACPINYSYSFKSMKNDTKFRFQGNVHEIRHAAVGC